MLDKLFNMKGCAAFITGAAQGLGKQMALTLAQAGSDIVIADIQLKKAQETAKELQGFGVKAFAYEMDVTDKKQVTEAVEQANKRFGKIDVLINDAGIVDITDAIDIEYDNWLKVINVNLNGLFLVSQTVAKLMIERKKGSIINIASMSGLVVNHPQSHASYNTSKAGVIMLTKSLAGEWAKYNVRVNAICPGYMNAGLPREKGFFDKPNEMVKKWFELTPMGRAGEPEELSGIVLYLASDASSFATGGVFVIDGGYTVW